VCLPTTPTDLALARIYAATSLAALAKASPALRDFVAAESALEAALFDANEQAAKVAIAASLRALNAGASPDEIGAVAGAAFSPAFAPLASRAIDAATPLFYVIGKADGYARATGKSVGVATVNTPQIAKVDPAKLAAGFNVDWNLADNEAIAALKTHRTFWVNGADEVLYTGMATASVARDVMVRDGLSGFEAAKALEARLKVLSGGVDPDVPGHWLGASGRASYFRGVATNAATVGRTLGSVKAIGDAGVQEIQINAVLDERTCSRCRMMDGRRIAIGDALAARSALLTSKSRVDVQTAHPWRGEKWFGANVGHGDESREKLDPAFSAKLRAAGVAIPPWHMFCRCAADVPINARLAPPGRPRALGRA